MPNCKKNEKTILSHKIESEYNNFESIFRKITLEEKTLEEKIQEVNFLINHIDQRIQYTETRLTRTITIAYTLIGIGLAFFVAIIRIDRIPFMNAVITSALLVFTGVITTLISTLQVNPKYPFRALKNDWKWFYPGIVKEDYRPRSIVLESEKLYLKKRLLHLEGLSIFAERIIMETPEERLKTDIQQLYLLHVNEKYKNCFLTTLRKIMTWGIIVTAISLLIMFASINTADRGDKFTNDISTEKCYCGND